MSNDPEPRLGHAPAPPASDPLAEPSETGPGQEEKAPTEDNELRCTLCGLRACWTG